MNIMVAIMALSSSGSHPGSADATGDVDAVSEMTLYETLSIDSRLT